MTVKINKVDVTDYVLTDTFDLKVEMGKDIGIEKANIDFVGIEELNITSPKFIQNANTRLLVEVFDDKGFLFIEGNGFVTSFDRNSGVSKMQVNPLLLELLNQKVVYFEGLTDKTPTKILRQIFERNDLEDFLDRGSFERLNGLFETENVFAGIDVNTDKIDVTIYDILNEMKNVFIFETFLTAKNKVAFYHNSWVNKSYSFPDDYIFDYSLDSDDGGIVNAWDINTGNFQLTHEGFGNKGQTSRNNYGAFPYSISFNIWFEEVSNQPNGKYLVYAANALNDLIDLKENPRKVLRMSVLKSLINEIKPGDFIEAIDNNIFRLTRLNTKKDALDVEAVLFS